MGLEGKTPRGATAIVNSRLDVDLVLQASLNKQSYIMYNLLVDLQTMAT